MTVHQLMLSVTVVCAAVCAVDATGQELFRDAMSSGAGWGVNANNADSAATFGYDYSADDIPEAPNSVGGDTATTGVKLEANLADGALSVFSIYPVGESFSGDYSLRFDAWINYDVDERINGGSAGTTEFIGGGIGYDDTLADVGVGAEVLATGDGGSGSDWRVFADGAFLDPAEMAGGSRNGFDPHFSDFLPGVSPPAGQFHLSYPPGTAGSPGFQWITFEIATHGDLGVINIEKPNGEVLRIAKFDQADRPFTADGNIRVIYADFFSSVTSRPDITFGVVDNVVVSTVPEPSSILLVALGVGGLVVRRRFA